MFVVRMNTDGIREFTVFRSVRDARFHVRHQDLDETTEIEIFEVRDTNDAEIAVTAVRDGLGKLVLEQEPDTAMILASMGLGTGLRI